MKRWRRLVAVAAAAAGLPAGMLMLGVMACGPDFEPEIFVPQSHPDNPSKFAEGRLGVLHPSYFHVDLVVAFRYLNGGRLSPAERAAYDPPPVDTKWNPQTRTVDDPAIDQWTAARNSLIGDLGTPPAAVQDRVIEVTRDGYTMRNFELNCTDGAFRTAAKTLAARTQAWGSASPEMREWARGQDAVFSNCAGAGAMPTAAQPGWSALLTQDRVYQLAAANFYAGRFDQAVQGFAAMGRDPASPWARWGEYLAARAQVRKAAAIASVAEYGQMAGFDRDLMTQARTRLEQVQTNSKDAAVRHAATAELNFIQVRLDPQRRLDTAADALAGPHPDPEFAQDAIDLDFLLDRAAGGAMAPVKDPLQLQPNAELTQWIAAARNDPRVQAMDQWQKKKSLPWLVAALEVEQKDASSRTALMEAAANVPPGSPAYVTVSYHRARWMAQIGRSDDARALLSKVLLGLGKDEASARNEFAGMRMPLARSLIEFLADAPRTVIEMQSEESGLAPCPQGRKAFNGGCAPILQFDRDAADALNREAPLSVLEQAAASEALPANLRDAVAWMAWLRALGLDDHAAVARLSSHLPEKVRTAVGESDGFPATLALLRDPGFTPYLAQGVQRSAAYDILSSFRDNWWCGAWGNGVDPQNSQGEGSAAEQTLANLAFLSSAERVQASHEQELLNRLPVATVWLGSRAIAWVKQHPEDKDAAEALALTVRATHFACSGQVKIPEQSAVSKQAFTLLHQNYSKSVWTQKTPYYY